MRGVRRVGIVTLGLALALAGALAGGTAASPKRCVVQLSVNVFGTSPGSNWEAQGALNAGQQATLRAVARGCPSGVEHISGRWVSGASGAIPVTQCSNATTCFLRVRSGIQSAADFQAFARSGSSFVRSNIVRVAWAGSCTAVGTWVQTTDGIGPTTWTVVRGGQAHETGVGNATGKASLSGHVLKITFVASDKVTTGVYTWTLKPNCRSGTGTLRFTGPATRAGETHASTVRKTGGG
jgi:hypothetical protein